MRSSGARFGSRCAVLAALLLVITCSAADYEIARPGYRYEFPRDNFSHAGYETEWWYYTGNVTASDGHRFGFELTFFRQAVSREDDSSPWYVHDLYMAHFALSDLSDGRYMHAERINRAGPGIAGVDAAQQLVWNGNWSARIGQTEHQLQAVAQDFSVDLNLAPSKPVVMEGRDGISQKAAGAEHASHYLSLTRMITAGSIRVKDTDYRVEGTSWMDHEFFTGSMGAEESGWDWVGLQFDNKTELMLYRMRHRDGSVDAFSSGSYIDASGRSTFLASTDFSMQPDGGVWSSAQTGARYPLRWRISVPRFGIECSLTTPLPDQELTSKFGPSYWEGAVVVAGRQSDAALRGVGYLEMTGYVGGAANTQIP